MDNNCSCKNRCCFRAILTVLVALLAGTVGVILGGLFAIPVVASLPALIIAAVVFAVLVVIYLVVASCACRGR